MLGWLGSLIAIVALWSHHSCELLRSLLVSQITPRLFSFSDPRLTLCLMLRELIPSEYINIIRCTRGCSSPAILEGIEHTMLPERTPYPHKAARFIMLVGKLIADQAPILHRVGAG